MFGGMWEEVIRHIDTAIAKALRRIGVVGDTIEGDHIGGQLPAGSYVVDNFRGVPLTEDLPEDLPDTDSVAYLYDKQSGTWRLGFVSTAPTGGAFVDTPVEYGGEQVEYGDEPVVVQVFASFAYEEDMEEMEADLMARSWMGL